jgi:hypothetical protein
MSSDNLLTKIVSYVRGKRAARLNQIILEIVGRKGGCKILDLGGEAHYWRPLDLDALHRAGVQITLLNVQVELINHPIFTAIAGDACDLSAFADDAFDLAHSNSVIEHVGEWSNMEAFAAEMRRVSANYYVQTPYFWFPIEPHFLTLGFHWLPETVRVRSLLKRNHGHHARAASVTEAVETIRSARLLDKLQMKSLFPDSAHSAERFGGLIKSLIAVRLADAA